MRGQSTHQHFDERLSFESKDLRVEFYFYRSKRWFCGWMVELHPKQVTILCGQ
jgi:hypothetical protein